MKAPATMAQAVFALGLSVLLAGCGLTAPRSSDGYADLDSLGVFDVDITMTLSIGPALLRFAARHMEDDAETAELLRSLDGVRVRLYEIDGDADRVARRIEAMGRGLEGDGWEPVTLVQEGEERTWMLVKSAAGRIHGLTVISCDGEEAVIVNVMGDLRPEFFSDTMAALDVDAPEVRLARGP